MESKNINHREKEDALKASLLRLCNKFLKALGASDVSVDIFLLPDPEISAVKRRLIKGEKGRREPNVLSFPEPVGFPHPDLARGRRRLGEIFLNSDILERSPERMAPLLLHGILHLMGHDHEVNKDAERMERLERKILKGLALSSLPPRRSQSRIVNNEVRGTRKRILGRRKFNNRT